MINLFVQYYKDSSEIRQRELDQCLKNNLQLTNINRVFVVLEDICDNELLTNQKATVIILKGRPTFNDFFELIRANSGESDVNIIANSDIYFDETIEFANKYDENTALALTRWEVEGSSIHFLNRVDSQDSWIVKGHPKKVWADFHLGVAGCDNALADRLSVAGYKVINPSKTIKTYHLHESKIRRYNVNKRVKQPYKLLTPTT